MKGRNTIMKHSRIAALLSAAALLLSGAVPAVPVSAEQRTFTVGFDAEFPPYGYQDDSGEYVGFDLSLADEVCKRKGWTLVKQPIDWDSKDMELETGQIDCIWNGFTINGREDKYTWSKPYIDNSQVVVVSTGSGIGKLTDLAGKVVAVQADSSALAALTGEDAEPENLKLAKSFAELQEVGDYNSAFMNLESGAVDAVCMDNGVASYEVNARGSKFTVLDEHVSSEVYGVGFRLGNTGLRDEVQETMYDMVRDGSFMQIAKDWGLDDCVCLTAPETAPVSGERKTFTVGFDAEFPPYGYQDDSGEYVGFDLSLAEEVCRRRGWELVKQPIDWDSKDMELESGQIDCIWNGFTINGREDKYTWSVPYVDNSQVVVVSKNSEISMLSDLAGRVVAVQADSSALAAFTGEDAEEANRTLAESFADLQEVGDYNSAFMNLESGAVDAICMDIGVARYEMEARGDKFRLLDEHVSSEEYGIGFLLGNTGLRDQVQETLFEMLDDGTFAEIAQKWGLSESVCLSKEHAAAADSTPAEPVKKEKQPFLERLPEICKKLMKGVGASMAIFFLTLLFALPLGLLIAFGRMSKFKPLSLLVKLYISIVRGTPLMLQLLVVFFGPYYLFGVRSSSNYRFYAVIIGFSLNYAAYFAEIYRSGIQAVPVGQHEACEILGYSKAQKFFKIVFPQMLKNIIPSITNEVITLVKDTSLAFAIAYTEMFTVAKQVAAAQADVTPLFVAGLFYYIFNFIVAFVMERIEKKLSYFR